MSTQRRVEQDQEQCAFETAVPDGFFMWKKSSGNDVVEGTVLVFADRLHTGAISTRSPHYAENVDSLTGSASGRTASFSFQRFGKTWDVTNSLNSSSCCQWRFGHGSGSSYQQLPLISPLLSSAFRCDQSFAGLSEPVTAAFYRVMQSALPQVPMDGLSWDGKATWPRKFVSPARRMKRGLPFWKTINSPRSITSGKMNTHSRDPYIKAA